MTCFEKQLSREKELTQKLKKMFPCIEIENDIVKQKNGVDAYIPNEKLGIYEKYDFKFTETFFLENSQKDGTTWCTDKHDPNIKVWFIGRGCWFLGDLVSIRNRALRYCKLHIVQSTGTTGWFEKDLGSWLLNELYIKRIDEPFLVDIETLESGIESENVKRKKMLRELKQEV